MRGLYSLTGSLQGKILETETIFPLILESVVGMATRLLAGRSRNWGSISSRKK